MGDLPAQHFLSPLVLLACHSPESDERIAAEDTASDSLATVPKSKVLGGPVDLSKHSDGNLRTLAYVTPSFYKKQKAQQSPARVGFYVVLTRV